MPSEPATVIVGGGLAAATTAEWLRKLNDDRPITIIGSEPHLPYERPPLSKGFLLGASPFEDAIVHGANWYESERVTVMSGETVTGIDRDEQRVQLASGAEVVYGTLILATGASPHTLNVEGHQLEGVHVLRTIEHARSLKESFVPGRRIAIVGSGWIGLEVASSARQTGMEVAVVSPDAVPLERVLGGMLGEYFETLHREAGVELFMGVTATGIIEREGKAAGLHTSAGEVPADLVLIAIGASPRTELAEEAGLAVDNGVLVDRHLRTSDPNILAIGDIANAEHALHGRIRVEHWDNAIRQGKLAASTITGGRDEYDWHPYFFTDQFDLGMEYVGHASQGAEVTVRGRLDTGEFVAFWRENGVVTAAMNVNIWDVNDTLRRIVGRKIAAAILADEDIPLEEIGRAGAS